MKKRLDIMMVEQGLAPSREKAKAYIMAGEVYVNGQKEDKAGSMFAETVKLEVRGKTLPYVSRGGLKLEKAMKNFGVTLKDKVCIGKHFPDTDPAYKGFSSVKLLVHVAGLLKENGYAIGNIDATIIAQKPKMAPHIPTMRENIAEALGIKISQLNIKATTEEGLGFTGQGEGISSQAICSLYRIGKLEEE